MATRTSLAATLLVAGLLSWPAMAQTTPAPAAPAPATQQPAAAPAATTPAVPKKAAASGKRLACQEEARKSGVKGPDKIDQMQVCVAQARVDCLKEAIGKKIPRGTERATYVKQCVG